VGHVLEEHMFNQPFCFIRRDVTFEIGDFTGGLQPIRRAFVIEPERLFSPEFRQCRGIVEAQSI
jgi:hypothetical protein